MKKVAYIFAMLMISIGLSIYAETPLFNIIFLGIGGIILYSLLNGVSKSEAEDITLCTFANKLFNTDIFNLDDAIRALDITKAQFVMVARGGVGNPFLLTQINEYLKSGNRLESPSLKEQLEWCYELGTKVIEEKGEDRGMRIYRSIAPKFLVGIKNCKGYRLRLSSELVSLESLKRILQDVAKENNIEFSV